MPSQTVTVRPLSYDDIARLAAGETLTAYHRRTDGLMPVTLTPRPVSPSRSGEIYYDRLVYPQKADRRGAATNNLTADPLGAVVEVQVSSDFDGDQTFRLGTTAEAEQADPAFSNNPGRQTSTRLSTAGYREVLAIRDDAEGTDEALIPVWGAQVSLTMLLHDIDAPEMLERAIAVLNDEFGDHLRIYRPKSRPVADRRVIVSKIGVADGEDRVVATNVLAAEVRYLVSGNYRTTPVDSDVVVGQ